MAEDHDVFKREFKRYKKLSPREALDTVSQTTKKLLVSKSFLKISNLFGLHAYVR